MSGRISPVAIASRIWRSKAAADSSFSLAMARTMEGRFRTL